MRRQQVSSFAALLGRVIGIAGSVWLGSLAFGIASHASNLGSVRWGTTTILAISGIVIALLGFWLEARASGQAPERPRVPGALAGTRTSS